MRFRFPFHPLPGTKNLNHLERSYNSVRDAARPLGGECSVDVVGVVDIITIKYTFLAKN